MNEEIVSNQTELSAMAEIPLELITEILLDSPVKSLLRFRCLSKPLYAMINSLDFINSHLARTSENMIHRKLIFQDRSNRFHVCSMNDNVEEEFQLKSLASSKDQVYGYCNGLLLLYRRSSKLALWNPSTRQSNNLPDFPYSLSSFRVIGSGLGYDSIDGYKVVLVFYATSQMGTWKFEVRSNTWETIPSFHRTAYYEFGSFRSEDSTGMFADGGLYWLRLNFVHDNSRQNEILAFDLRTERLSTVPLPVYSIPGRGVLTDLHVLEGRLCISFFCCFSPRADLHMRNKDQFSWTQLYSITESICRHIIRFDRVKVLGYSKRRDSILLDFCTGEFVSYDLAKKSCGKAEQKRNPLWYHPILCVENLVSIRDKQK